MRYQQDVKELYAPFAEDVAQEASRETDEDTFVPRPQEYIGKGGGRSTAEVQVFGPDGENVGSVVISVEIKNGRMTIKIEEYDDYGGLLFEDVITENTSVTGDAELAAQTNYDDYYEQAVRQTVSFIGHIAV